MSDELDRLYERALELPREARASFATEACGDETLRTDLLSLISAGEDDEKCFAKPGSTVLSPPLLAIS